MNFSCPIEESETQASKATSRLYMGAGLVVAGLFLGFLGMQLRNPRAISGSWVLAFAVASMGATALNWSLDTRKTARWMAKESLTIEPTELLDPPFSQRGGLGKARQLFGPDLDTLLTELTQVIAA